MPFDANPWDFNKTWEIPSRFNQIRASGFNIAQFPPFQGQMQEKQPRSVNVYNSHVVHFGTATLPHSWLPHQANRSERKSVSLEGLDIEFCSLMSTND